MQFGNVDFILSDLNFGPFLVRSLNSFIVSKSGDRKLNVVPKRGLADLKALKFVKGSVGLLRFRIFALFFTFRFYSSPAQLLHESSATNLLRHKTQKRKRASSSSDWTFTFLEQPGDIDEFY